MRVAVIDLGTNTCRLFLADVTAGRVAQAERLTTVVRLGQGVDKTSRLHEDAVARTHACLAGYAPRLEAYGPARRLLIATSVLRDARDGRQFLKAMRYEFGLPWRILSGEEEGSLAFRGGTSWLAAGGGDDARPARDDHTARPPPARRHRRRQHRVRGRLRRTRLRRSCAASTSAWCGSPSASSTPTRRRRRRSRPSRATSPPPSPPACPPTSAPPCAARSEWPAPTPRWSPTSSACASTTRDWSRVTC